MSTAARNNPTSAAGSTAKRRHLGSIAKSTSDTQPTEAKLRKYYLQSVARELAPHHRVRSCMRARIPRKESVDVWFSGKSKTAYYTNLMRCASVWVCPLCASAITEKRLNEISARIRTIEEIPIVLGDKVERTLYVPRWKLGLATFTISHRAGVSLESVLHTLDLAYKRFWGGRWSMGFREHYHIVGTIRALEVTHGRNGWHPHIHTLFIRNTVNYPETTMSMELDLQFRWDDCVSLAGGMADKIHGVDYRAADESAAEYIAKMGVNVLGSMERWDAISEVIKYPVKRGRQESMTIWDMLSEYAKGDVKSGELWIEAQRNLRGRRHLVASKGLYDMLGAYQNKNEDIELAQDTHTETDILLASLTLAEWRTIVRKDLRGEVVAVASSGDRRLLLDYLESIL